MNNAIKSNLFASFFLAPLFVLVVLFPVSVGALGQTQQPNPMPPGPPIVNPPVPVQPPQGNQGDDITRREVAAMDQFLDSHPEIAQQLRRDPTLIDNQRWVADHSALQEYLQNHPGVSQAFRSNPNLFMRDEERYDRREGDREIPRRDIAEMDRFLDSHPEISEQLRRDPSLIDNRRWVTDHPALQEYLQNHPGVSEAFRAHPEAFMRDEERYDRQEGRDHGRDRDITRKDLQEMDRFLDRHPEVAEQLRKDPSLIENREWVAAHSDLREFLEKNPQVRQEFKENPNAFMRAEDRYDQHEGDRDRDHARDFNARTGGNGNDNDRNREEFTSFGQFLGGHSNVATELSNDPSLATNKEYLATHPELDQYLKAHPAMSQQLTANPQGVMSSTWVQQNSGIGTKQSTMPKEMPKEEKPPNQ